MANVAWLARPGNREKQRRYNKRNQWRDRYGIKFSLEEYDQMLQAQKGLCALCRQLPKSRSLHVDHDHETGRVRGLLCMKCNRALGYLQDSPVLLRTAAKYLEGK